MPYRYTDEVVKLYIPKHLIQDFHPHPEPFGFKMVTLINQMYTDVYKDKQGYYSLTNDLDLIEYVMKHEVNKS